MSTDGRPCGRIDGLRLRPFVYRSNPLVLGAGLAAHERLAGVIDDAQVHSPCVQIDAAVKSVLLVETHHGLLAMGKGVYARIVWDYFQMMRDLCGERKPKSRRPRKARQAAKRPKSRKGKRP